MKRFLYAVALCAWILVLLAVVCSCEKQDEIVPSSRPDYDVAHISDYIQLDAYTDLSVTLTHSDDPKGEAVWAFILERVEVLEYPEAAVDYYAEQERQACRYYAKKHNLSYEDAMKRLGVSEEQIQMNAERLVKEDLTYEYIRKDAGIVLTENEKSTLFDRYAEAFAEQYGYDISEVRKSMAELVYESMLHDKTMEYLIVHNTFSVAE
jgi:hypothetical protein